MAELYAQRAMDSFASSIGSPTASGTQGGTVCKTRLKLFFATSPRGAPIPPGNPTAEVCAKGALNFFFSLSTSSFDLLVGFPFRLPSLLRSLSPRLEEGAKTFPSLSVRPSVRISVSQTVSQSVCLCVCLLAKHLRNGCIYCLQIRMRAPRGEYLELIAVRIKSD